MMCCESDRGYGRRDVTCKEGNRTTVSECRYLYDA
jgi:hypothetical protein